MSWIRPPSASVSAGSDIVTIAGLPWAAIIRPGYELRIGDVSYEVLSAAVAGDNTSVRIDRAWTGAAGPVTVLVIPLFASGDDAAGKIAATLITYIQAVGGLLRTAGSNREIVLRRLTGAALGGIEIGTAGDGLWRIGCYGDDSFRVQRAPDGATWSDVMVWNAGDGRVTLSADLQLGISPELDAAIAAVQQALSDAHDANETANAGIQTATAKAAEAAASAGEAAEDASDAANSAATAGTKASEAATSATAAAGSATTATTKAAEAVTSATNAAGSATAAATSATNAAGSATAAAGSATTATTKATAAAGSATTATTKAAEAVTSATNAAGSATAAAGSATTATTKAAEAAASATNAASSATAAAGSATTATTKAAEAAASATSAASSAASIGFTPVQQGGGTGQGTDKVYIGGASGALTAQLATAALGNIWTDSLSASVANTTNGYFKLPNGWIVQVGTITLSSSDVGSVTFPTAFPTKCYGVFPNITENTNFSGVLFAVHTSVPTTTGFTVRSREVSTGNAQGSYPATICWFAVGR